MRSHVRPLSDPPQLEIIRTRLSESGEDAVIEYRVQNFRRGKDGTIQRGDGMSWIDVVWLAGLVMAWRSLEVGLQARQVLLRYFISVPAVAWLIFALLFLFRKTRTVLYESMIALPGLGVQLQTTRGISIGLPFLFSSNAYHLRIPLSTTSELVPLEQMSTIVIHEGLRRWRVEYYLAIIKRSGSGIVVGFPNVRPPVAVLREVYHGLRETLFDEFDDS